MSSNSDPLDIIGQTIGGYTIVRFCGTGAAGRVYEAKRDGIRFALKIYRDWLFEEHPQSQDDRIAREAETRRVTHPNVCKVFEFGRATLKGAERRYLVMEFIDGEPLDKLIQNRVFAEWKPFAAVARSLIDAVSALHAAGCIHRDVKPANIMLETGTERVVLTDFGVVADLEATTLLTEGHEFLGTMAYAAPEWLLREPETAGREPAIDVYSVGATLYEMIGGERLFADKRNRHQLARAVAESIPTVSTPTGYPSGVASLIREMLAKTPESRPTLDQVQTRLTEIVLKGPNAPAPSVGSLVEDPYARFRQAISQREDVRRSADQDKLTKQRWDEFEAMWDRLEKACEPFVKRFADLPGIIDTHTYGRMDDRQQDWENRDELRRSFPDRSWTWGRSFDFIAAFPAIGVQLMYFFHGLEDHRTGITRFVATHRPRVSDGWPSGLKIQIEGAQSWMGPLDDVVESAIRDVSMAERLAIQLLNDVNRA
jgi:serine/threonine protein kinase